MTPTDKQDLRHAVLYAFANRPNTALTPMQARQSCARLLPFSASESDVLSAILFHASLGNLSEEIDPWGSETSYTITAAGTLAYERDQNKIA